MDSRKRHNEKLQHNQRGFAEMVNKNRDYSRCISDSSREESFASNNSFHEKAGRNQDDETGEVVVEYYWHEETLGLACYAPGSLTFIGQDLATDLSAWAIFEARPASTSRRKRTAT
jgi:hypothetical protein